MENNIKVDITGTKYAVMDFIFKVSIIKSNEGILWTWRYKTLRYTSNFL